MRSISGQFVATKVRSIERKAASTFTFNFSAAAPVHRPVEQQVPPLPLSVSLDDGEHSTLFALAGKGVSAAQARLKEGMEKQRFHRAYQHPLFQKLASIPTQDRPQLTPAQFVLLRDFVLARLSLTEPSNVDAERALNVIGKHVYGLAPATMASAYTKMLALSPGFQDYAETVGDLLSSHAAPFISLASAGALVDDVSTRGTMARLYDVCRALSVGMNEGVFSQELVPCFENHVGLDTKHGIARRADSPIAAQRARAIKAAGDSVTSPAQADGVVFAMNSFADADGRLYDLIAQDLSISTLDRRDSARRGPDGPPVTKW